MTPERFRELLGLAYGVPFEGEEPPDVVLRAYELRWFIDLADNANRVMTHGPLDPERRLCYELGMAFPPANSLPRQPRSRRV